MKKLNRFKYHHDEINGKPKTLTELKYFNEENADPDGTQDIPPQHTADTPQQQVQPPEYQGITLTNGRKLITKYDHSSDTIYLQSEGQQPLKLNGDNIEKLLMWLGKVRR